MRRLPIVSLARVGSETSPHRKHSSFAQGYVPQALVVCSPSRMTRRRSHPCHQSTHASFA